MKTLFILPNAIGDVICGTGIARHFANDGKVSWFVNPSAADVLIHEPVDVLLSPSARIRRMRSLGAPTEIVHRECERLLSSISDSGPWDRVVNVHLSRASSIIAGAADARIVRGSALSDRVQSQAWADFFISSLHLGLSPELPVPSRFSLIAGLGATAWPDWSRETAQGEHDGGIVFIPGSGWPSKALGCDQAALIAARLSDFTPVTLVGGPKEREFLNAIRRAAGANIDIAPGDRLRDAVSTVLAARLVVTTDTWALHAACAARIPVLALLGSTRIMPWRHGLALAPDESASWKNEGDRSIEKIEPGDVASAARALWEGEEPDSPSLGSILWDCRGDWPSPHRPPQLDPASVEKQLFILARAEGFATCVERYLPGEPRAVLRPFARLPELDANLARTARKLLVSIDTWSDRFPLFETTFPGKDASAISSTWMQETRNSLASAI